MRILETLPVTVVLAAGLLCPRPADAVQMVMGPIVQTAGPSDHVIAWETDVPTPGKVVFGEGDALDRTARSGAVGRRHEVHLGDLPAGIRVSYRVMSGTSHSDVLSFTTLPAPDQPLELLVLGDTRTMHHNHKAVAGVALSHLGQLLLNTGDLVERGDSVKDWDHFFAIEGPLLARTVSAHAVGNHDLAGGGIEMFLRHLVHPGGSHAPERDFFIDAGPARFVVLDNAVTAKMPTEQKSWLVAVLEQARELPSVKHVFVVIHQGVQSNGPHGPSKSLIAAGLDDVMRDHGVALVIGGHDHGYERGTVDGLRYLVSGGGGAPVYSKVVDRGGAQKKVAVHHVIAFAIEGDDVSFTVYLKDGSILESCRLAPLPGGYSCQ